MFLSTLKLWNFRKYGSNTDDLDLGSPHLKINFRDGTNILIGENDSGKTAIIDAIKICLKTHSRDWIRLEFEDFFEDCNRLRIETHFEGFTDEEASHFTEWLSWIGAGADAKPYLKVILDATRKNGFIQPFDIRAGADDYGHQLTAEAREFLKTTYLKPLRDAKSELIPKRNSRLSQIISGHEAFKGKESNHTLVSSINALNEDIEKYFEGRNREDQVIQDQEGKNLKDEIDRYLSSFHGKKTQFKVSGGELKDILESLLLLFEQEKNLGLGSHNLLFISSELLHLNKTNWTGIRLGLIEELEAHLHPQIQLQVIDVLQGFENIQLIITTHSPNIASKVKLDKLILCHNSSVYPMRKGETHLDETDYHFLERFLDVTKANLFFAKGVILVEGWAEEIILPELAKKIGINLTEKGVSIVNLGSTAFLRYAKIFQRTDDADELDVPVAIITDLDIKPDLFKDIKADEETVGDVDLGEKVSSKEEKYNGQKVKTFVSNHWTLEYCLALSEVLRKTFYKSVLEALKEQKQDSGVADLTPYNERIDAVDVEFNNWTDDNYETAFAIYYNEVLGKKISKSIIAQRFAQNLKELEVGDGELEGDVSIQYLMQAIKYASRDNQ